MIRSTKIKRTIKRSPFYHLIQTIAPINHGTHARWDFFGVAVVIGIVIGGVLLVRSFLNAQ